MRGACVKMMFGLTVEGTATETTTTIPVIVYSGEQLPEMLKIGRQCLDGSQGKACALMSLETSDNVAAFGQTTEEALQIFKAKYSCLYASTVVFADKESGRVFCYTRKEDTFTLFCCDQNNVAFQFNFARALDAVAISPTKSMPAVPEEILSNPAIPVHEKKLIGLDDFWVVLWDKMYGCYSNVLTQTDPLE